jgi:serine/threonine-protein kinase RsbT
MGDEVAVQINSDADLVSARAEARSLATRLGFSRTDTTLIATAISEIARNIVVHAGRGQMAMRDVRDHLRYGLTAVATDEGPGIHDIEAAMLRQLSTLFADASLAVHARSSIEEVLQLVAAATSPSSTGPCSCISGR